MIRNAFGAEDAVLPSYFPGVLFRMLVAEGVAAAELLDGTGLNAGDLDDEHARFSFVQHRQLMRNAMRLTGDPHLGLRFGRHINVTALGILGYAALSSKTVGEAIGTVVKYFAIRAPLFELSLVREPPQAAVQIDEALEFGDLRWFLLGSTLCATERLFGDHLGRGIISHATLACPEPPGAAAALATLGFPCRFGQPHTRLYFAERWLAFELPTANPQTASSTRQICEQLLAKLGEQNGIVSRCRALLLRAHGRFPTLDQAAAHFCVSPRTLRRELQKAGTTWQTQVDRIRESIAVEYLTTTRKPLSEIAFALGYDDLSNFRRAFRRWTGRAPGDYRG